MRYSSASFWTAGSSLRSASRAIFCAAGMTAADHVRAIRRHAPGLRIHDVLLPATPISPRRLAAYADGGARPLAADLAALRALGCRPVRRHVLADGDKIRHDPGRLAAALLGADAHHLGRGEHEVHSYSEVHHARQGM